MFEKVIIPALAFHLAVMAPSFQDLVPVTGQFTGILNEFTLMDNVKSKAPIIDVQRHSNILQRRDASCDLLYKKLITASNRTIAVEDLYAATQHCKNGFYQGALKDWEGKDPLFGNKILPWFQSATMTDIASNAYFGDQTRPETDNMRWSTTKYDGVWKWVKFYAQKGTIPSNQYFTTPTGDMRANPSTAFSVMQSLVDRQPDLMRDLPAQEKAIYTTGELRDGYQRYLRSLGEESSYIVAEYANGVKVTSIDGIPILVDPLWQSIMSELYGSHSNAAILTIRGNFVFATDKEYGEGPNGDMALMVWYSWEKMSWFYQQFLRAGTQIAIPEFIVFCFPA